MLEAVIGIGELGNKGKKTHTFLYFGLGAISGL